MLCKVSNYHIKAGQLPVFLTALLLFTISLACLSGCTKAEDKVQAALDEHLSVIKTHDSAFIENLSAHENFDVLETYSIDTATFIDSFLSGFDYSISNISVDGKTATADLQLTAKRYGDFLSAFSARTKEMMLSDEFAYLSFEDSEIALGEAALEVLSNMSPSALPTITVSLEKENKEWILTKESEDQILLLLYSTSEEELSEESDAANE